MQPTIPVPEKGNPLRASWGAGVANRLNALASMSAPGLLARDGLTGTGCQPLPANRRDRRAKAVDRSCFRIETRQEEDGSSSSYLTCCYYHVGGVTRHMPDVSVDQFLPAAPAAGEESESGGKPWLLCFKLSGTGSTPSVVALDESKLEDEQRVAENYVLPLYRYLGRDLQDDLRNAPNVQQWELDLQ